MSSHLQSKIWKIAFAWWLGFGGLSFPAALRAGPISVPNGSFESPVTVFVNTHIDSWQEADKPDWYDESGGYLWDQLTGVFKNTPTNSADHIDNCDGNQAAWMFAVPQVALFQDYNTMDWDDLAPSHNFNATFEVGKSYHLTVGIIGGGGNMLPGASLQISLYYRDLASNMVTVGVANISNSPAIFSNTTHLVDFKVDIPAVRNGDPWLGQKIGVQILSTVSSNLEGGYWDLDNVRLSSVQEPALLSAIWTNGQFQFTLQSEPGLKFEILASSNPTLPESNWTSLGTITNFIGATPFVDVAANSDRRFYLARQLP